MEDNSTLIRIRELCKQRGWSLYKLAKESDISYSSLNNIFIRNTQPTIPTLEKICEGFKIPLSEFFADSPSTLTHYYVLSEDEEKLISSYRSISKDNKKLLEEFINFLVQKSQDTKDNT